jgi:hypothetical protein
MISDITLPSAELIDDAEKRSDDWPPLPKGAGVQLPSFAAVAILALDPSPTVSLITRVMCGGVCAAEKLVWQALFGSCEAAILRYDWLASQPHELEYWARHAETFGGSALLEVVEHGITFQTIEPLRDELQDHRATEFGSEVAPIESNFLMKNGKFGIGLQRGAEGPVFWSILFRENWERERFLDWWTHQRHRLRVFAEFKEANSAIDLERLLLHEMLETEHRVRKSGLGSGGRRPLRFWRGDR